MREHRYVAEALERLAEALEELDLGPGTSDLAAERDRLAGSIRSYLIPRASDPAAPLTVVVAGPTGSGKSTLVNSLTGVDASATGALRPTTRTPVVVTPAEWPAGQTTIGGVSCQVVSAGSESLDSVTVVDTPDIDSTSTHHRVMAENLIDHADVVIFVTSALRYADDVPWQVLRRAESRGTPVIHVLNRVESASAGSIVDFKSRLSAAGFDDDLITVSEHHLSQGASCVPDLAVRSLRKRLDEVVSDRNRFAVEVFARVVHSTVSRTQALVRALTDIHDEIEALEARAATDLVARVPRLDLEGAASGLYPDPPTRSGSLARRRWRKRARRDRSEVLALEAAVTDRLVQVADTDVRLWLVEEEVSLRQSGVDFPRVVDGVLESTRSAVEGWVDFVARIASDFDEPNMWLCEAVLLEAATENAIVPAVALLFGEDGEVLVERARRELIGRLEVVYENAASLVVEGLRRCHGDVDGAELGHLLGAATAVLPPVHA